MKFQVQTVTALALISGASAFCPAPPMATSSRVSSISPSTHLAMGKNDKHHSINVDFGKAAMSLVAASVMAVSSANTMLPVEPAFAATAAPPAVEKSSKKADLKKLAPEEQNKIAAKKNLDLAEQTLKEYTKIASDAKSVDAKASSAFKGQEKVVAGAKKTVAATSDKLSAAKNQKMPQTAIKELTDKAAKAKDTLKAEEKKLSELSKAASKASGDLKSATKSAESSKAAIKSAKKKVEKTEKEFQKYTKKVQAQKKKEAEIAKKARAAAQKALQEEEKKVKALEAESKKLASLKESSQKELEKKAKLLQAEKKSLEKMKATTK